MHHKRPVLVIMAKLPVMGGVKSRLARDVGAVRATAFQRINLAATASRLAHDTRWQTVIAVSPDNAVISPMLPLVPRMAQGGGDLGERMSCVFQAFPTRDVLIIGADIAAIRPSHIATSWRLLRRHGAVLAPSGDGGYWLVGIRSGPRPKGIFDAIRWSTQHALADTQAAFARVLPAEPALGPARLDVDTAEDFEQWRKSGGMRTVLPTGA